MKLRICQLGALITGTEASGFLAPAAPDLVGPTNAASPVCAGCYLVADVAGELGSWTD